MKRFFFLFVSFCLSLPALRAQPFAIGNWREHLPYLQGKAVAITADRVYCATADGLFALQRSDNSLRRFSKLNGLNDFGIQTFIYSPDYKVLVIAYSNTNIDLLYDDDKVINLSDIKRKNIPGSKVINRMSADGRYIYLSCGFGIVVLDLQRREIKDTYYISNASASPEIMDVASDATWLYAAADDGVYRAALNDPFIANFNAWTKILGDTGNQGVFNHAEFFSNTLLVNYNRAASDTLLAWNGSWGQALPPELQGPARKLNFQQAGGELYMTEASGLSVFDNALARIRYIDGTLVTAPDFNDGMEDASGDAWIADKTRGLLRVSANGYENFLPEGPNSPRCAAMQVVDGTLWVIHGPKNRGWRNAYQYDGFSVFSGSNWVSYDGKAAQTPLFPQYNFYDNMSLAVDPSDKNHLFIGSSGAGLIEFKNGQVIAHYDTANSPIQGQFGNPG
ncbi:MAG: hypothetical protein JNL88_04440, partial [Bacteroidia bacterium]|nr:hypothetical protein [Bacteroidia bacterium]